MTRRRGIQVVLVLVQVILVVPVVGRVEAVTTRGEVLAVLLSTTASVLAAATRRSAWLATACIVAGAAMVAAGRPTWQLAVLGAVVLGQLLVVTAPADVRVLPVAATVAVTAAATAVLADVAATTGRPPSLFAGAGIVALAAASLAVLLTGRSDPE